MKKMNQSNEVIQNRGGMKVMNRIIRKLLSGVLGVGLLMLGLMMTSQDKVYAYSDAVSSNNVTALTVLITPNVDRGVEISSGNVHLDLGNVDLNASTYTVRPATVTIVGTASTSELTLAAAIGGGWNFDADPLDANSDQLATWALFSSIAITSPPVSNDFTIFNSTINSNSTTQSAAQVGDALSRYEGNWSGSDMDSMAPQAKRHLWIKMRTPSDTTVYGAQTIVFDLAVEAAN